MMEMAKRMGMPNLPDGTKVLSDIILTSDVKTAAQNTDLISESIPENHALKREVHARFESLCPQHTIITTNTSSLSVSEIAIAFHRPEIFAAMHFHSGLAPLVDIMAGAKTASEIINKLKEFVKSVGLIPMVMRKETPGYFYNNILIAMNMMSLKLAATGSGTPRDIDRAWMMVTGNPIGPFGILDAVGINVAHDIARSYQTLEEKEKIIAFLLPYIDKN